MIDSHTRQKFLNPLTLRLAQLFFDGIRYRKVVTESQEERLTPFFIIGSGRSGTTLLRSVLQRHPELNIPPESMGRIPNCVKKYYRYGGLDWEDLAALILGEFSSFDTFDLWKIDLQKVKERAVETDPEERSLAHLIDLVYREHTRIHKPGATLWGDKSPFNTLRLKWIHRVFPMARYIHIIRDGRDVVSSYLKANLMNNVEEAADRWKRSLAAVSKFSNKIPGARIATIRYERFVEDPKMIANHLCNFLDLEYHTAMVDERAVNVGDEHLDHMKNVEKPITSESVGKWKTNLDREQRQQVERLLLKQLIEYDYLEP